MASMYQSFSHALHSLRNPHFFGRSNALLKRNHEDEAEETVFYSEISNRLSHLDLPADGTFLTLPWLQDGANSVLCACSHIFNLLPRLTFSDKEKVLLESNLEDTLSLLDVCNCLKEVLNDVQRYVMLVRYAVRSAVDVKDTPDEDLKPKLYRLHVALVKSMEFMDARMEENGRHREGRSKLETCSSMLRRMGEPLPEPSPGSKHAASRALFDEMYAAKVLTIFVCSVFALSFSVKPKRPLSCVHMAEQPTWLHSLQKVQENVKNLTDKGIEDGKIAFLKELDDLRTHTDDLNGKIEKSLKEGTRTPDIDKTSLIEQCEKLSKGSDDLQQGLLELQKLLDCLFRTLVTIRVDFLDAICHV